MRKRIDGIARESPGSPGEVTSARQVLEIFLAPGDFYFGDAHTRIRTVLGSCVAITIWHPVKHIGGMCHYMLPTRTGARAPDGTYDGRYGDEAIARFVDEAAWHRTRPGEYDVKLFGGGNMFPDTIRENGVDIGRRNIDLGLSQLAQSGFRVIGRHLAGQGHRSLIFEVRSGDVWLRHTPVRGSQ